MSRPWMPFYVGDYLRDTGNLTTVQHGAYCLLLFHYWARGGLPDDDNQLASITRLPMNEWRAAKPTLQTFFYDGWKHKRIEAELRRTTEKVAKARIAGAKGGAVAAMNREINRHKLQQLGSDRYSKR
jgi:uncharacterized protein YdaU (DUF1376 family)